MFSQVVDKATPARSMHHRTTPGKDAFAKFNYICGEGQTISLLGLTTDAAPFANFNGNICALRHSVKHNECSTNDLRPDSLTRQNPDQRREIGMALRPIDIQAFHPTNWMRDAGHPCNSACDFFPLNSDSRSYSLSGPCGKADPDV